MYKVSTYRISLFVYSILFISIAGIIDLRMFDFNNQTDGFFIQVLYASKILSGDFDMNGLFFIHVARLIIVLPFYGVYLLELPAFVDAVIYLLYLSPLLSRRWGENKIQLIFIFFPIFFSYRTSIGMCGMGYLYLILIKNVKSYYLFAVSALLANLSSGIVLSWGIVVLFSLKNIFKQYLLFIPVIFIVLIGFLASIIHKVEYMLTDVGMKTNGSAIERSTIYVSFIHDQYLRLIIYMSISFVLYAILNARFLTPYKDRVFIFFLAAAPGVFLEGIGLISYLMCIFMFLSEVTKIKRQVS